MGRCEFTGSGRARGVLCRPFGAGGLEVGDAVEEAFCPGDAGIDEVPGDVGPVEDEVSPGEAGGGGADHGGEEDEIEEDDHHEGEEGAVFLEVGLVLGDHPDGPDDVETPGGAEEDDEAFLAVGDGGGEGEEAVDGEEDDRPEGDEVGGEGDHEVRLVRHDVAALGADAHVADATEVEVDEEGVGHFVTEDVEVEEFVGEESGEEPGEHEADADGEADELFGFVEVVEEVDIAHALEEGEDGDEAERHDHEGGEPTKDAPGPREVEFVESELIGSSGDGGLGGHAGAASRADVLHVFYLPVDALEGIAEGAALRVGTAWPPGIFPGV